MSPPRPLVPLCAALVLGSAAGLHSWQLGLTLAAAAAAFACALSLRRARGGSGSRSLPVLTTILALTAARSAAIEWGDRDRAPPATGPTASEAAWAVGAWQPKAGEWARLGGVRLRVEPALARAGEIVLVCDPGTRVRAARGPEDGSTDASTDGAGDEPADSPGQSPGGSGAAPELLWVAPFVDDLVRLAPARRSREPGLLGRLFGELRAMGLARTEAIDDPGTRGLCAAILFGERTALDRGTVDLFTRTGARHALALSGLHVGLVAALVILPLGAGLAWALGAVAGRLGIGARPRPEIVRAALVLALVPIGGGGSPIARAAVAVALGLIAPLPSVGAHSTRASALHAGARRAGRFRALRAGEVSTLRAEGLSEPRASESRAPRAGGARALRAGRGDPGRRVDPPSLFAFALGLECLADPRAPASLGLLLSYCAAAALLASASPAARRLRAVFPARGRVAATWASGHARSTVWTVVLRRLLDATRIGLAAALVATLATLPLIWSRFGEWSPAGMLASPLVVLGLAALLCAAWAWMLLPGVVPESVPASAASALIGLLEGIDRLPGTPLVLPERPLLLVGVGALSAIVFLRTGAARAARLAAGAFGLAFLPWGTGPRGLELVALDVGHGSAVLVRAPGSAVWLFDAGSRDRVGVARAAVAPLLRRWEARELNVVATHADRDHVGALPWIVERWPPGLWAGALPAHIDVRLALDVPRIDLDRGRVELLRGTGDGLALSLTRGGPWEGNEGSRSLVVTYRGRRALLSGDAEAEGLARMLDSGDLDGPFARVLSPHHGSRTRLLGAFLDRTAPEMVWTSAAEESPSAEGLELRGIPSDSTARSGALIWRTAGRIERVEDG